MEHYSYNRETEKLSKYPNLKLLIGATAIKFNVNDKTKQVNNVLFISTNGLLKDIARKENVLFADTFFSTHLIMLSGIDDSEILQQNKIPIKHELKQIGKF